MSDKIHNTRKWITPALDVQISTVVYEYKNNIFCCYVQSSSHFPLGPLTLDITSHQVTLYCHLFMQMTLYLFLSPFIVLQKYFESWASAYQKSFQLMLLFPVSITHLRWLRWCLKHEIVLQTHGWTVTKSNAVFFNNLHLVHSTFKLTTVTTVLYGFL